ncbi:hypothetical protein ARMSODRAFT_983618 [Armillaria solidipes]|uniref:Uncharacterized protein n=1 Tax=Armillaria solidipes TaxID=1076256 RepID=A0A2H3AI93_9AGAR|nr:hypothetical protein ARMSODRAFT_983618 [Armillaria solidipes]
MSLDGAGMASLARSLGARQGNCACARQSKWQEGVDDVPTVIRGKKVGRQDGGQAGGDDDIGGRNRPYSHVPPLKEWEMWDFEDSLILDQSGVGSGGHPGGCLAIILGTFCAPSIRQLIDAQKGAFAMVVIGCRGPDPPPAILLVPSRSFPYFSINILAQQSWPSRIHGPA